MPTPVFPYLAYLASLPDPASAAAIGWIVLVLAAIAFSVNQILSAVNSYRALKTRDPQIVASDAAIQKRISDMDAEIREEIREVEMRMEKRIGENLGGINARLTNFEKTLGRMVSDFSLAIGRLEGRADSATHHTKD